MFIDIFILWKWRNDRRSERNLCNCVGKPEKNSGLQRGLNPWPRDYRCDTLPTELWSHWRWEQVNCGFICSRERNSTKNFYRIQLSWCDEIIHVQLRGGSQVLFPFVQIARTFLASLTLLLRFVWSDIRTTNLSSADIVKGHLTSIVGSYVSGIARSRVQTPLKSWIFFRLLYAIA